MQIFRDECRKVLFNPFGSPYLLEQVEAWTEISRVREAINDFFNDEVPDYIESRVRTMMNENLKSVVDSEVQMLDAEAMIAAVEKVNNLLGAEKGRKYAKKARGRRCKVVRSEDKAKGAREKAKSRRKPGRKSGRYKVQFEKGMRMKRHAMMPRMTSKMAFSSTKSDAASRGRTRSRDLPVMLTIFGCPGVAQLLSNSVDVPVALDLSSDQRPLLWLQARVSPEEQVTQGEVEVPRCGAFIRFNISTISPFCGASRFLRVISSKTVIVAWYSVSVRSLRNSPLACVRSMKVAAAEALKSLLAMPFSRAAM